MPYKSPLVLACLFFSLVWSPVNASSTLDVVKKRGYVTCGVSQGLPGFSNPNNKGQWQGIDIDLCRAVAAAIFGDDTRTKYLPLSAKVRFTALQSGEIDVLTRNTTLTMHRESALGLDFPAINFYDGQGFMVRRDLGVKSASELNGVSVCTNAGTTTERNAADYFKIHQMRYEINTYENANEALSAYDAGRCDAYTTDVSALHAQRLKLKKPKMHMILPEVISKEPLGPVVREGDNQWSDLVAWVFYTMLTAEELGITSDNVDKMKKSTNPSIRRLLGVDGEFGAYLGLSLDWAYHIIRMVGNYEQSFDRNIGKDSPLKIQRGMNALWTDNGLQYAPPIR